MAPQDPTTVRAPYIPGSGPSPSTASATPALEMAQIVIAAIADDTADEGVRGIVRGLADWAGITALDQDTGEFSTEGPTDDLVVEVDAVQYRTREGPCVHAATHREVVISTELVSDARWPTWGPHATGAGVSSVLSVPVHSRTTAFGAMNLYRATRSDYDHEDLQLALLAAGHVGVLMAHRRVQYHLERAVTGRTIIGQAQGLLMERYGLDAAQAFSTLRRYSQHGNTKLQLIAEQIVETRQLPDAPQHRVTAQPSEG